MRYASIFIQSRNLRTPIIPNLDTLQVIIRYQQLRLYRERGRGRRGRGRRGRGRRGRGRRGRGEERGGEGWGGFSLLQTLQIYSQHTHTVAVSRLST